MMSGLSHGDVMSITQDPMGYVWVATANGLNRFDGQRFININSNNSGLGSNALNCVTQLDSDPERLWIATQRDGIFYYEHSTGEVKRPQGIPFTTTDVTTITPASDGGMWVNHYHYGPQYFNPLTGETRSYTFDKVEGLPKISWATAEGRDGKLYVGHAGEGFSVIDTITRKASNHRHIEGMPSIPGDEVYAVCTDRNGNVWLGTDRGAAVYLPESGKTIPFVNNPSRPESIIPGRIRYITQTSSGEIWFASTLAGVCVLDPVYAKEENLGNARFKAIPTTGHGSGTSNAYARTIFEDSFGNIWIGNYRTGVDIVNHLSPGITRVEYTEGENSNSSYLPTWC